MTGLVRISGHQFINIIREKDGLITTLGYNDRDTALIKAGLELGHGGMVLHCALPVRLTPTAVFHPAPED